MKRNGELNSRQTLVAQIHAKSVHQFIVAACFEQLPHTSLVGKFPTRTIARWWPILVYPVCPLNYVSSGNRNPSASGMAVASLLILSLGDASFHLGGAFLRAELVPSSSILTSFWLSQYGLLHFGQTRGSRFDIGTHSWPQRVHPSESLDCQSRSPRRAQP